MKLNNNLYAVSGGIKCGKDLVGEMINYFGSTNAPSLEGFEYYIKSNEYDVKAVKAYEIKKFADKLKDCVALIIGCTREQLEDQTFKATVLGPQWWYYKFNHRLLNYREFKKLTKNQQEYFELIKLTPRLILQLLGTEGGRKIIHPDIWVNALFADYKSITNYPIFNGFEDKTRPEVTFPNWIITDMRFPENEGVAINERNGLRIGIKRNFALRFPEYAHLAYDNDPYMIPDELEDVNPKLYKGLNHASETSMGDLSWCDIVIENNGTIEELFDKVLQAVAIQEGIV